MSFAKLKERYLVAPKERFPQLEYVYEIPQGWYNVDLPEHRIYKNDQFPGEEFFSATTVLGKIAHMRGENGWLALWRERIGDEAADAISKAATDRGTAMHQNLQDYVENGPVLNKHASGYRLFEELKPWCDTITAVVASEAALASRHLKVAGRTDLVAVLEGDDDLKAKYLAERDPIVREKIARDLIDSGIETLVDFKSSRRVKSHSEIGGYYRQVTLYQMQFQESTVSEKHPNGIKLELGEIWMGCDNDGNPVPLKFPIVFGNFRETVIDEVADLYKELGNPIDKDEAKRFFL